MFCQNCGKDMGGAKFCQYCGGSNDAPPSVTVNLIQNDVFTTLRDKIKQIGQERLIKFIAVMAAVINVIIRIANNEIEVVYSVTFAQDDYLVLSESGRNYMLIVCALQIVISLFLFRNAKKEQTHISKKAIVLFVISLAIQVLAMVLRVPAPY